MFDKPTILNLASRCECKASGTVIDRSSRKTVCASSKLTLCLRRLARALSSLHFKYQRHKAASVGLPYRMSASFYNVSSISARIIGRKTARARETGDRDSVTPSTRLSQHSVARFRGLRFFMTTNPSDKSLGYFRASASRTNQKVALVNNPGLALNPAILSAASTAKERWSA
jgi:hypothetical protein